MDSSKCLQNLPLRNASLTVAAVSFLPKQPFSKFEGIWAEALLITNDFEQEAVLASLLAHFGSGTATALVVSKLDAKVGEWACAPQAAGRSNRLSGGVRSRERSPVHHASHQLPRSGLASRRIA